MCYYYSMSENPEFENIGPFEGEAFEEAMDRLRRYPQLINNFTDIISRRSRIANAFMSLHTKNSLQDLLLQVHDYDQFQKKITCDLFLNLIEKSSIDVFSYDGITQLGEDKPRIYISNHRDIVLDTALLDLALYRTGRTMCEMVIGDNLLVNSFARDMFKCNGAITIRRSLSSAAELKEETMRLSRYIAHCYSDKKESIWIAQKSGRSKDGKDDTSGAIVKMLYLASREQGVSFSEFIDKFSIVPVAISYQYDPCDVTKSQDQIRKLKAEGCYDVYKKKKYQDILDLVRGLRLNKGNVHIQVGTPLKSSEIQDPRAAVREIDRQIHVNYRLWDTNYYAWDKLNKSSRFADKYQNLNIKAIEKKYSGFNKEVIEGVFSSYANPVQSMLNETESN